MKELAIIMIVLGLLTFGYRLVYMAVRITGKQRPTAEGSPHRYAVMIAARNEEKVIGNLIDSLKKQDYPGEPVDIYVVADNCTDSTARVAKAHGARVFTRHDTAHATKGYALEYLYNRLRQESADYDGYFIFDADNIVDRRYISEMNKVFSGGADIVVGYRNTKNFGESWVSACSGIYYLYESEFANRPRDLLGISCFLSGTGCLFSREYLERSGGWSWTGLTEDLECTLNAVSQGEKIAYCHDAVTYDEQPCRMSVSVTQRIRWVRGYLEAVFANRQRIVSALFRRGGFAVYDFMMNFAPFIGTLLVIALEVVKVYLLRAAGASPAQTAVAVLVDAAALYMGLYAMGAVTLIVERNRIRCSGGKLLLYSFTFPLFMLSYLPVCVMAIVRRPQWTHIAHNAVLSIEELS